MSMPGWPHDDSPFHRGEQEVQARVGVRAKVESAGRRVVRAFMPEQHREFFSQLPFVVVGAVAADGRPWASMLVGEPGFMNSPDPALLRIDAPPFAEDPIMPGLKLAADVGVLGIELHTRRRNRMNGRIVGRDAYGMTIQVAQSFGNCPKYIQQRAYRRLVSESTTTPQSLQVLPRLDSAAASLIRAADTFFIATHYAAADARPSYGADVSHRGGKPGFVRVDDAATLTWPEFVGNFLFNTLGNLTVNPRAGLLFPDFTNGDLLLLSGRGEIIWDGDELQAFAGAERLLRYRIERIVRLPAALPLRWQLQEYSPFLANTGAW
ncbi:MAG: pyridoxamine 5'-phosphate oxidase family protein [Gammaproteobacteria bacterium]|nr:pyridoxamine 5'-phosphate oxidase family protein [Gammaproteobacteria bacterium]